MKRIISSLLIISAILLCGCTAQGEKPKENASTAETTTESVLQSETSTEASTLESAGNSFEGPEVAFDETETTKPAATTQDETTTLPQEEDTTSGSIELPRIPAN